MRPLPRRRRDATTPLLAHSRGLGLRGPRSPAHGRRADHGRHYRQCGRKPPSHRPAHLRRELRDPSQLQALNVPLNRWGGNPTSRYNWQLNADNRARDWYFQSIASREATPAGEWTRSSPTRKRAGRSPWLTIPILGWVAKLGANREQARELLDREVRRPDGARTASGSRTRATASRPPTGQPITGNDPNDANVLKNSTFQQRWVQHLVGRWGNAQGGGVRYYILDNEPASGTRPTATSGPTGAAHGGDPRPHHRLRRQDQGGRSRARSIVGPEEWGWSGYFCSGYDLQYGRSTAGAPGPRATAARTTCPGCSSSSGSTSRSTGQKVLDVFTVHYYPQGGEFGNATTTAMQQRRNRSTRSLWDPNYVDETWINDRVRLVRGCANG